MKKELLFDLIHSMDTGEKRFFSLQHKKVKGDKNYLKLYRLIQSQSEYNEEEIKRKFKGEKVLNQFHVLKNYLKDQLMAALKNYHEEFSMKARVNMSLIGIEILFHKGLFYQCKAEIEKVESLALQYEMNLSLIEIYIWKRRLCQAMNPFDIKTINDIIKKEETALQKVNQVFLKKHENVGIYSGFLGGPNIVLSEPKEISDLNTKDNFEAFIYHQHSKYYILISQQKYPEAEKEMLELIQVMENKAHFIEEDPGLYLSTVNNVLGFRIFTKNYNEALATIEKVKSRLDLLSPASKQKVPIKELARISNVEMEIYRDNYKKGKYDLAIDKIKEFVSENELKLNNSYLTLFWFQFASINFSNKEYNQSLKWINKLLNMSAHIQRADILVYSRILNLMIHYELNNLMVLGYYIDGLKRFLNKQKLYNDWRKSLIRSFSKLRKAPMMDNKMIFKNLHDELFAENSKLNLDKNVLDYIDIKKWVEFKMK